MIKLYNSTGRSVDPAIKKIIKKYKQDLSLIISYGGDGTLLGSERDYPDLAKLPIRASKICNHCYSTQNLENIFKAIKAGQLKPKSYLKLEAGFGRHQVLALNEINIKCQHPNLALRFSYDIDQQSYKDNIADGIIIATPFGSTAYFKSITNTVFDHGIGIAVNNSVHPTPNNIVSDDSWVTVTIDRQKAYLLADNNPKIYKLKPGDKIVIKKSDKFAQIY